jgi:hypothetical protein
MNTSNDPLALASLVIDYLIVLVVLTVVIRRVTTAILPHLKRQAGVGMVGAALLLGGVGLACGMRLFFIPLPWLPIRRVLSLFGGIVLLYQFALACYIWRFLRKIPPYNEQNGGGL